MSRWNLTQKTVRGVVPLALIDHRIAEGSTEAGLLRNSRKTECGADKFLACFLVRAAPFALLRCQRIFRRLDAGGWGCRAFLSVQILGERKRSGRALFHGALHRFLV